MQKYSLHTHTKGFDALNTVEEMALAAKKLGWEKIGISNHFVVYPDIERTNMYRAAKKIGYSAMFSVSFEEAVQKTQVYFNEIDRVRDQTGFTIYKSMEVDFFDTDKWKREFDVAYKKLKPDYIICSAHFVEYGGTLMNKHDIIKLPEQDKDKVISKYWYNIRQAVKYGAFDFMAHLDVLKRKNIGEEEKWIDEEAKTVEVIIENKIPVEINTSGMKKSVEPSPSLRILKMLSNKKIPMFLSDDAHCVPSLGQDYEKTEDFLKQNGLVLKTPPVVVSKYKSRISLIRERFAYLCKEE